MVFEYILLSCTNTEQRSENVQRVYKKYIERFRQKLIKYVSNNRLFCQCGRIEYKRRKRLRQTFVGSGPSLKNLLFHSKQQLFKYIIIEIETTKKIIHNLKQNSACESANKQFSKIVNGY